jgi:uncharacterized membrane protein
LAAGISLIGPRAIFGIFAVSVWRVIRIIQGITVIPITKAYAQTHGNGAIGRPG